MRRRHTDMIQSLTCPSGRSETTSRTLPTPKSCSGSPLTAASGWLRSVASPAPTEPSGWKQETLYTRRLWKRVSMPSTSRQSLLTPTSVQQGNEVFCPKLRKQQDARLVHFDRAACLLHLPE